jgi:drug/metabolite transporter (DMT)-like permease
MAGIEAAQPWVVATLASALLFAAGNALQKLAAARRLPRLSAGALLAGLPRVFAGLLRSPVWLLGLLVTVVAVFFEIQALALADVSLVKPLSRVQMLFALGIGVVALGERLARAEWLGVAAVLAAAVWLTSGVQARVGGFDVASAGTLAALAGSRELPLSLLATLLAFALQQLAFARGRVSLVVPLVGASGTATVVLLGVMWLGEPFGPARALGVGLLLLGSQLLARAVRGPRASGAIA